MFKLLSVMKGINIGLNFLLLVLVSFHATSQVLPEAYNRGFHVGYCQAKSNAMGHPSYLDCVSPVPPIKGIDATYSQGVVDGTIAFTTENISNGSSTSVGKGELSFLLNQPSVSDPTMTVSSESFIKGLEQGTTITKPDVYYYYLASMPPVVEVVINKMDEALKNADYIIIENVDGSTNYMNKMTCEGALSQLFASDKTIISLVKPLTKNKLPVPKNSIANKSQYLFVSINTDYLPSYNMGAKGKVVFKSKDVWRTIIIRDAGGSVVYKARLLNIDSQYRYKHLIDPYFDFKTVYPQLN